MKEFLYNAKQLVLFVLILLMFLILTSCNVQVIDTQFTFNYAIINTFDGRIEGEVTSWRDYKNGDQLQVTVDGVTYLTHSSNVILEYRR